MRDFRELWRNVQAAGRHVCVGLDSELAKIPGYVKLAGANAPISIAWRALATVKMSQVLDPGVGVEAARILQTEISRMALKSEVCQTILAFNQGIVSANLGVVRVFKINLAFYLSELGAGIDALIATIAYIHAVAPDAIVILDAKFGDIGNTNDAYVRFLDLVGADAVTLHGYLGKAGSLDVFLSRPDKGCFVLCHTTNPGATEFQEKLLVESDGPGLPLYEEVAIYAKCWNENGNIGLVAGATYPVELGRIREIYDGPLLIPGIGKQAGALRGSLLAARNGDGEINAVVNMSRNAIFVSDGGDNEARSGEVVAELHQEITGILAAA
jgi:orotidine-5'-phosphate decarboxylase